MRRLIPILTLLMLISCESDKFSKTEIANEIIEMTTKYNDTWESVDMDLVSKFHDEEIRYYWHGFLASSSNQEFLKVFKEWMTTTKVWEMEVDNFDVQVINKELAIIGFNSTKSKTILIDGESLDYGTGAFTYIWKKTDGKWKIIHIHESALEK